MLKLTNTWHKLVSTSFNYADEKIIDCSRSDLNSCTFSSNDELIQNIIKLSASDSKNRAQCLIEGRVRLGVFGDYQFTTPIDWKADPFGNRTWQWLFHQLAFLGHASNVLLVEKSEKLIKTCMAIIEDWSRQNFTHTPPSEFSWGDHSTAHRLKNLLFFYLVAEGFLTNNSQHKLLGLISVHCKVLSSSKFYNKFTNHGLDQALYLLLAACYLPQLKNSKRFKYIATKRLENEISYGFCQDGAHSENSPQYHYIILNRLAVIEALRLKFEIPLESDLEGLFIKALSFARHIKRPDNLIPIIGDSELRLAHLSPLFASLNEYKLFYDENSIPDVETSLYADSGYFIYRRKIEDDRTQDLHLILKCGHKSDYHRQDDDGSFVLMYAGEDWFVEGGLFRHSNTDEIRQFMRSNEAHSLCMIKDIKPVRSKKNLFKEPSLVCIENNEKKVAVKATTYMYPGYKLERVICILERAISVRDDAQYLLENKSTGKKLVFHIPSNKKINLNKNSFIIRSNLSSRLLEVKIISSEKFELYLSKSKIGYSKKAGMLERSYVVNVEFSNANADSLFEIIIR